MVLSGYVVFVGLDRGTVEGSGPGAPPVEERAQATFQDYPIAEKVFVGVTTEAGPRDWASVDAFETAAEHPVDVLMFSQGWARDRFDRSLLFSVANRGTLPMVAWEPWDYRRQSPIDSERGNQPGYRLARILAGDFDPYIREWAEGVAQLPFSIAIRFAHEMNGTWYPWAEEINGNSPGEYAAAWRHVVQIFRDAGADNVYWVWSPNILYIGGAPSLAALYPGDEWVDWVGIVGYFGHGRAIPVVYPTFDELYGPTIAELRTFTAKPLVLTEVGATERGGLKVAWIDHFLERLRSQSEIVGFVWFEVNERARADWRIVSSEAARAAFARGLSGLGYR
jgi:hypothetical protein